MPCSLGMVESTDELDGGEQGKSFWLAAPEEGGQPQGQLLLSPPVVSPWQGEGCPQGGCGDPSPGPWAQCLSSQHPGEELGSLGELLALRGSGGMRPEGNPPSHFNG